MSETDTQNPEDKPPEDRSGETLTPQEAHRLRDEVGLQNKSVAKMFGVSESRVSQLYNQYKEARDEGRESVDPTDFEAEELERAIEDKESESPYHTDCPHCGEGIPVPDSAGQHDCPECGVTLSWDESEI